MARKLFPCDVNRHFAQRDLRYDANEIPTDPDDIVGMLDANEDTVGMSSLPWEFEKMLKALDKVHFRAREWVLARLDGMTDIEIAKAWGITPQGVYRWSCVYGQRVRAVFEEFLEIDVPMDTSSYSNTHLTLMKLPNGPSQAPIVATPKLRAV